MIDPATFVERLKLRIADFNQASMQLESMTYSKVDAELDAAILSELTRAREREKELAQDAERYRYLRNRPEDTIGKGGVFAGMTPPTGSGGHILTEEDLDRAVDRALAGGGQS